MQVSEAVEWARTTLERRMDKSWEPVFWANDVTAEALGEVDGAPVSVDERMTHGCLEIRCSEDVPDALTPGLLKYKTGEPMAILNGIDVSETAVDQS